MEPKGSLPCLQGPVTCPYPELDQSIPRTPSHILKIHFNIICAWVFQMVSFPQVSPPKPCMHLSSRPYVLLIPSISYFSNWSLKYLVSVTDEQVPHVVFSSLFVMSSLLGPYISLSNLFSNTLSLHTSQNVNDQVSHPYTTGRNVVLYTLIFICLDRKLEDKRFCTKW